MHLSRPQSESTAASDAERDSTGPLRFIDLGRMAYGDAYVRQKAAQDALIAARQVGEPGTADRGAGDAAPMTVFFVEHDPPVITVSRRKTARTHLTATPAELEAAGVDVAETDRGGDITYHGPGQLVVYPVLDLNRLGLRLHGYMRMLEQIVIDVLGRFDIVGERDDSATGVWVPPHASTDNGAPGPPAKICAMGVRISRWVTLHGLALNVTTNLDHFRLIVPCGLAGRPVTSMQQLLGDACPTMAQVRSAMREQLVQAVNRHMRSA
jgi:lipoyl(octanoyl) transferase